MSVSDAQRLALKTVRWMEPTHTAATGCPARAQALAILVMTILVARLGRGFVPRGVPFVALFGGLGSDYQWAKGLELAFFAGVALAAFALITGRGFGLGVLVAGAAELTKVLGNMGVYSNGWVYDALLLLLAGLCVSVEGLRYLRAQCILLYLGAALAKARDVDWWNGQFIGAMFDFHFGAAGAERLAPLAQATGIATVFTEASIGVLLLLGTWFRRPVLCHAGVALALLFHTALVLLVNEDFATFYYTVLLSAGLLFMQPPRAESILAPWAWLARCSAFDEFRQAATQKGPVTIRFAAGTLEGATAWLVLGLSNVVCLALVYGGAALAAQFGFFALRNTVLGAAALAVLVAMGLMGKHAAFAHRSRG